MRWTRHSLLAALVAASPAIFGAGDLDVAISEVHYHPFGAGDPSLEFVELHNRGTGPVDISGWSFSEGIAYRFSSGSHLEPDGRLVVSPDVDAFRARHPSVAVTGNYTGLLANDGEILVLQNATGREISRVHYLDSDPWPELSDGKGPSLELLREGGDLDRPDVWAPSRVFGGTPGQPNSRTREEFPHHGDAPPLLRISEVAVESPGGDPGFVELLNNGVEDIDLTGYTLHDAWRRTGVFPAGLRIGPGKRVVAAADALGLPLRGAPGAYVLAASGGATSSGGATWVDTLRSPRIPGGFSLARIPGAVEPVVTRPTPGEANGYSPERRVVFNEISFAFPYEEPSGDCLRGCAARHQWVELANRSDEPVALAGWSIAEGVEYAWPDGAEIPARGFVVVCASQATFRDEHPGVPVSPGEWLRRLGSREDTLVLRDALGNAVDRVHYGNGNPVNDLSPRDGKPDGTLSASAWPSGISDSGRSIELIHPDLENASGHAWRAGPKGGTPGARNAAYDESPPPVILHVAHSPAVPRSTEAILVTCEVRSVGPVAAVRLLWHVDGRPESGELVMTDQGLAGDGPAGDSVYGAWIPPQADGSVVAYRIGAAAAGGVEAMYPPVPPSGRRVPYYLCEVDDTPELDNGSVTYRIIMTSAELNELKNRDRDSDVLLHATFIASRDIHHLVGIRYRGETSRRRSRKSYRLEFPPERTFQGIEELNLNGAGDEGGVPRTSLEDFAVSDMFRRSGRPYVQEWPVNLHFRGGVEGDLEGRAHVDPYYIRKETFNRNFLSRYFGGSDDGNLYRARDPQSGVGTGDLSYRGSDPDSYRAVYDKESNRDEDDFSDLVELTRAFDSGETPADRFEEEMLRLLDTREWAAFFAIQDFCTNIDGGIQTNNGEDYFLYRVPSGSPRSDAGRWLILPWDLDENFDDPRKGLFLTRVAAVRRFLRVSSFAALYLDELNKLCDGAGSPAEVRESIAHARRIYPEEAGDALVSSLLEYARRRLETIDEQVVSGIDVEIPVDETPGTRLVREGDVWSYFKGRSEPSGGSLDWARLGFDASSWPRGLSGFGYGDNDDATVLDDMREDGGDPGYLSLYIRRTFEIPDPSSLSGLTFVIDYDDAFVAYLNGAEIARSAPLGAAAPPGSPIAHDYLLGNDVNHEASRGGSGAEPPESHSVAGWVSIVQPGQNVLAVQGFNSTRDSSDFSLIPEIVARSGAAVAGAGWGGDLVVTGPVAELHGWADASATNSLMVGGVLASIIRRPPASGPPYGIEWTAAVPVALGLNELRIDAFPGLDGLGLPTESADLRILRIDGDFTPVGGQVTGSSSWTREGGPYLAASDVDVEAGASLTIEPGARVYFRGGASLKVSGRLLARGTPSDPILLLPFGSGEPWGGIEIGGTGTSLQDPIHILENVHVQRAGAAGQSTGCIRVEGSRLRLEDVRLEDLGLRAVDARDSRIELEGCTIRDCPDGLGARDSSVAVLGSFFAELPAGGVAVRLEGNLDERCRVEGCVFESLDGSGLLALDASADILRNEFRLVAGAACGVVGQGPLGASRIDENTIREAGVGLDIEGGVLAAEGSHDTVVFCLVGLRLSLDSGQPPASVLVLDSSIVWGNAAGIVLEGAAQVDLTFSDAGGPADEAGEPPWPGTGNLRADPVFVDTFTGDFSLSPGSPCKGAGKAGTDMGANGSVPGAPVFLRGDVNEDENVNLTDAVVVLLFLFQGGGGVSCEDAADADDNGKINLTDAVYILLFLFQGGDEILPPYPESGPDPTSDALPCDGAGLEAAG